MTIRAFPIFVALLLSIPSPARADVTADEDDMQLEGVTDAQDDGFMDYTDDACLLSGVPAPGQAPLRACAVTGRTSRAYQHNQSNLEFGIVSPRDAASGLPTAR